MAGFKEWIVCRGVAPRLSNRLAGVVGSGLVCLMAALQAAAADDGAYYDTGSNRAAHRSLSSSGVTDDGGFGAVGAGTAGGACCNACADGSPCGSCDLCRDDLLGVVLYTGIDSFRQGPNDGDRQDNFGARFGGNVGLPLIRSAGIGVQLGATTGLYDWQGRANGPDVGDSMVQTFVTAGLFRNADLSAGRRLSWAVAYDWMIADNWTERGDGDITVAQYRGQIGYALSSANEIGVYGAFGADGDSFFSSFSGYTHNFEPIDQIDLFWHHAFRGGAHGRFWIGLPEGNALFDAGSRIDWIVGASLTAPVTSAMSVYAGFQYGSPSASAGGFQSGPREQYTNVSIGLVFYPRARSNTVANCRWNPLLPVADNMNFLLDEGRPSGGGLE